MIYIENNDEARHLPKYRHLSRLTIGYIETQSPSRTKTILHQHVSLHIDEDHVQVVSMVNQTSMEYHDLDAVKRIRQESPVAASFANCFHHIQQWYDNQ